MLNERKSSCNASSDRHSHYTLGMCCDTDKGGPCTWSFYRKQRLVISLDHFWWCDTPKPPFGQQPSPKPAGSKKRFTGDNPSAASESDRCLAQKQGTEYGRKVTLTAHWYNGGTVSMSYSPYATRSVDVSFDKENWDTSTTLTITPKRVGVTTVTFSNDVDSHTFKMVVIVID